MPKPYAVDECTNSRARQHFVALAVRKRRHCGYIIDCRPFHI
jgi:hypothetical protein